MLKPSSLIALFSLGTVLQAAQPTCNKAENECAPGPRTARAAVRHIEAGGVGYNQGYSTLEAFVASDPNQWCVMPFLDLRGHIFNDGKLAANAGLGARSIWGCRAYGINAYYDYRNTHKRGYNQVSLGLETLGELWDIRVNGYLPVGAKVSHPYNVGFAGFSGNSILVDRKFQYAMKGIDGEVGFHFGKTSNFDFYGAAGPYYFKGEMGKGAIGGKVRLAAYYKEYVTLELSDSFDNVFHNNVQGQLTLTLPLGPKSKPKALKKNCPNTCEFATTMARRMLQPVNRQEIVVIDSDTKTDTTSNFVIFVDNQSHSAGTFESPYPTLADAEDNSSPGDIIYVFPGDETTTGMNEGIALQDNQQLLGSSTAQTLITNLGTIIIPAQTTVGPTIGNITDSVISLANNNVISGFTINTSSPNSGYGIKNTTPITNLIVKNNTILTYQNNCINLTDVGGDVSLYENTMAIASYGAESTINITNTNIQNADYSIYNNNLSDGRNVISINYSDCAAITTSITNNRITNDYRAISIILDNSASLPNHIFNISSNNIHTQDDISIITEHNNFSRAEINIKNNMVDNGYEDVLYTTLNNSSTCDLNLYNNSITSVQNCIDILAQNESLFNLNASQNFLGGGDGSAINIQTTDAAIAGASIKQNTLTSIDASTVNFLSSSTALNSLDVTENNLFTTNYENVINCNATGEFQAVIQNNNIYTGGLAIQAQTSSSNVIATVTGNQFIISRATITNTDSGSICLEFQNNTATPVQYSGGTNPYTLSNADGGTFNITPCNYTSTNIGFFSTSGTITSVQSCSSGVVCP